MGTAAREVGVPTAPISAKDPLAFDQLAGVVDGGFRLVPVVERHQFESAAVDPALLIHLAEGRLHPEPHVPAQLLGWPAKGGGLAEEDAPIGDAGLFLAKRSTRH